MPGIWAAAGAAVAGIAGSVIQGDAAKSAAQTQANAAQNATQAQLSMFDTTQANLAPFMKSGTNALSGLNSQLGIGADGSFNPNAPLVKPFSMADYHKSPGYNFQFGEGVNAVQNSAAARGGIGGGNTLRALTQFGQGLANSDYQTAFQNYMAEQQQRYGMLANTAGSGQNAAAGLGAIGTQVGGQIGSNIIGAGNARAAGQVGSANAIGGGLNSLGQLGFLYANQNMGGGAGFTPNNAAGYGGSTSGWFSEADMNSFAGYSDYGLKKNLEPMYIDGMSKLRVYEFHYKTQDDSDDKWRGYVAQEVLEKYPEAVSVGPKGFLKVDYAMIPSSDSYPLRIDGVFA